MAAVYFAVNREGGSTQNSLVVGTDAVSQANATQTGFDFELRVNTVDLQGNVPTEKDVVTALDKIRAYLINGNKTSFPPL